MMDFFFFSQVARKLVIVEGELERTEERAELAEGWVSTPGGRKLFHWWGHSGLYNVTTTIFIGSIVS